VAPQDDINQLDESVTREIAGFPLKKINWIFVCPNSIAEQIIQSQLMLSHAKHLRAISGVAIDNIQRCGLNSLYRRAPALGAFFLLLAMIL